MSLVPKIFNLTLPASSDLDGTANSVNIVGEVGRAAKSLLILNPSNKDLVVYLNGEENGFALSADSSVAFGRNEITVERVAFDNDGSGTAAVDIVVGI